MLATLDDVAEKLYRALETLGSGYHDRTELAAALGKQKLNPVDNLALESLVDNGRIEGSSLPIVSGGRGRNITRRVYRIKEQK